MPTKSTPETGKEETGMSRVRVQAACLPLVGRDPSDREKWLTALIFFQEDAAWSWKAKAISSHRSRPRVPKMGASP